MFWNEGGIDNLDDVVSVLDEVIKHREQYHIHVDGALFAQILPHLSEGKVYLICTKFLYSPICSVFFVFSLGSSLLLLCLVIFLIFIFRFRCMTSLVPSHPFQCLGTR